MYKLNQILRPYGLGLLIAFVYFLVSFSITHNFDYTQVLTSFQKEPAIYLWYATIVYVILTIISSLLKAIDNSKKKSEIKRYGTELIDEASLYVDVCLEDEELNPFEMNKFAVYALKFFQDKIHDRQYEALEGVCTKRFYDKIGHIFPKSYSYNFEFRKVKNCKLISVVKDTNYIGLTYEIAVSELYYETDDVNKVSDGNKDIRQLHVFELTLIKRRNYKESKESPNVFGKCYNCGIDLVTNDDNACVQCNANLASGSYGFVIDSVQLVDNSTTQHNAMCKMPFIDHTKRFKSRIKKAHGNKKAAINFIRKNNKTFMEAKHRGKASDYKEIMTDDVAYMFEHMSNELKHSKYTLNISKQVIWNILLLDFYDLDDKLYYVFALDGKKKEFTENDKGRTVLGDFTELQYYIAKLTIVYDKNDKTYKLDEYHSLFRERIK